MFFGCLPCCGDSDICRNWESVQAGAIYIAFQYSSSFVDNNYGTGGFSVNTTQTALFPAGTNAYHFTLGQNAYRLVIFFFATPGIIELIFSSVGWNGLNGNRVLRLQQNACAPNVASFSTRATGNFPNFLTNTYIIDNFSSTANGQQVFATNTANNSAGTASSYSAESQFTNRNGQIAIIPDGSPGELSVSYSMRFNRFSFLPFDQLDETLTVTEFYSAEYGNLLIDTPVSDLQRDYLRYSSGVRQNFP